MGSKGPAFEPSGRLIAALCVVIAAAGCSSGRAAHSGQTTTAAARPRAAAPSEAGSARERRMEAVVRAWSVRLNAGDNAGIARLFALPAVVIQGPYVYRLKTRHQVALWHSALPCSGRIVSITFRGRFATAVFKLGNRGATRCDQPGSLAAARFEIVGGKIASWQQVMVPAHQAPAGPVA
jgi:hypothetical protein